MAHETEPTQPETSHIPTGRAAETFERAGENVGAFAVHAGQRLQSLLNQGVHTVQNAASRAAQGVGAAPQAAQPAGEAQGEAQAATERQTAGEAQAGGEATATEAGSASAVESRAEEMVDAFGHRLSEWSHTADQRLRAFWARMREEGEDIWAEAQELRRPDQTKQ
jgi:hypothetical protein